MNFFHIKYFLDSYFTALVASTPDFEKNYAVFFSQRSYNRTSVDFLLDLQAHYDQAKLT